MVRNRDTGQIGRRITEAASDAASIFRKLSGVDISEPQWSSLIEQIGILISKDDSLRGDLAHSLLYNLSREPKNFRFSISNVGELVSTFASEISKVTNFEWFSNSDLDEIGEINAQKVMKFIHREIKYHRNHKIYVIYIMLLSSYSVIDGKSFSDHHVFREIGQLRELFERMAAVIAAGGSVERLVQTVKKFSAERAIRSKQKPELGALIEVGEPRLDDLWALFPQGGNPNKQNYRVEQSLEKHFVCFRSSSLHSGAGLLAKSFVILQSPGQVKNNRDQVREHFTFKVFYRTQYKGKMRRSAGIVFLLGDHLVCLGSSREISRDEPQDLSTAEFSRSARGPKVLVLDARQMRTSSVVFGLTMSMNEKEVPIVSPICCVETSLSHSDQVEIGRLPVTRFADDLSRVNIESANFAKSVWSQVAKSILEKLTPSGSRGVIQIDDDGLDLGAFT